MAGVGKERAQGQCFGKARISQRVRQAASVYDEPWDREDSAAEGKRFGERFASRVMPIFKRQSDAVRELILELYLYGLASVDFELALRELLGDGAPLSASSLQRLKQKWDGEDEPWKGSKLGEDGVIGCDWGEKQPREAVFGAGDQVSSEQGIVGGGATPDKGARV